MRDRQRAGLWCAVGLVVLVRWLYLPPVAPASRKGAVTASDPGGVAPASRTGAGTKPDPGGVAPASPAGAGIGPDLDADPRGKPRPEVMPATGEVKYLVLADRAAPYLLARVRWPDVAQAISAASHGWIEDPGLFDLPYDPNAVTVSFNQAASVAAGWGTRLNADAVEDVPSYVRRMPANWSDLSPSERRTWGVDFVGRRHAPARPLPRLRTLRAKVADASAGAQGDGQVAVLATPGGAGADADRPAATGRARLSTVTRDLGSAAAERRGSARVTLAGRAHIRLEQGTVTAGLVDLSERGVQCVMPKASALVAKGATLTGPFLLEAELDGSRICLNVAGEVSWRRRNGHFGIALAELANGETEGVQQLLAAAGRTRGRR